MNFTELLFEDIFKPIDFEETALEVFRFQAVNNIVYKDYLHHLNIDFKSIKSIDEIPHLPISFFKTHQVKTGSFIEEKLFLSSGTTNSNRSKHLIKDLRLYKESFYQGFKYFYGNIKDLEFHTILPSYHENPNSSLIYMTDNLIERSHNNSSHFISVDEFIGAFKNLGNSNGYQKILIGVTYALLDLATYKVNLKDWIVMETGGMKGKRKETTRSEVHKILINSLNIKKVHSEYGMTELLSQAYSKGEGIFTCPPWMRISTRPINNPFANTVYGATGVIKIIDLANVYSCSFIETEDIGKVYNNHSFEILGRLDKSQARGCNLMYDDQQFL